MGQRLGRQLFPQLGPQIDETLPGLGAGVHDSELRLGRLEGRRLLGTRDGRLGLRGDGRLRGNGLGRQFGRQRFEFGRQRFGRRERLGRRIRDQLPDLVGHPRLGRFHGGRRGGVGRRAGRRGLELFAELRHGRVVRRPRLHAPVDGPGLLHHPLREVEVCLGPVIRHRLVQVRFTHLEDQRRLVSRLLQEGAKFGWQLL
ncbi:MAG: hypothetical protein HYY88_11485, partial [candidate division NC10 bacterium]|nr:hypothetical protein [candidate division NC10 bacterium]